MLYLAVVQAVGLVAVGLGLVRHLRSLARENGRREAALIDRLMHATGQTWTPPPADTFHADTEDVVPLAWTPSPEQLA